MLVKDVRRVTFAEPLCEEIFGSTLQSLAVAFAEPLYESEAYAVPVSNRFAVLAKAAEEDSRTGGTKEDSRTGGTEEDESVTWNELLVYRSKSAFYHRRSELLLHSGFVILIDLGLQRPFLLKAFLGVIKQHEFLLCDAFQWVKVQLLADTFPIFVRLILL